MINDSLDGLLTGLSLIVVIGAQNAYLLRQGLRRMRVGVIVAICTLSDLALIAAGVSGIGAVVQHAGWALVVVRWFGVAFLAWYGLSSAWRARRGDALRAAPDDPRSRHAVVRQTLAFTWLNPNVYLDTVVLIGSIANAHGPSGRWWFAAAPAWRARCGSPAWDTAPGCSPRCSPPRAPGGSLTCSSPRRCC